MFRELRNRIVVITMVITTVVLILAGTLIMVFSSATRPEPKTHPEISFNVSTSEGGNGFELEEYIRDDRKEGSERLLVTLLGVGTVIEAGTFFVVYFLSRKIIEPVEESYDKQKLFIANASHELKTPLAVIQANMEAIEVDKDNEKWKLNIENEIDHANKLVLDLLTLARMDAGKIEKKEEDVNLGNEIKRRVEMFRPKFGGKITFKKSGKGEKMMAPKQDLLQVLDILLDNAVKYGDKKVVVRLEGRRFSVLNDGVKIKKEDLARIFDRFYQTDKSREGSGLGLAIAKAICEQNKWQIKCESGEEGVEFRVMM